MITIRAFAKVNLSLNITGRQATMHTVDSVMSSVSLCDVLTIERRQDSAIRFTVDQPDFPMRDNTILRAAMLLGASGLDITLHKSIPSGAGLGGASADAAAALVGINAELNLGHSMSRLCQMGAAIGSDVPFALVGGCARVTGTGQLVQSLPPLEASLVLARDPDGAVSTAQCYATFDQIYPGGCFCPADNDQMILHLAQHDYVRALEHSANALVQPAVSLSPSIIDIMTGLGARAGLSGSGNTCWALGDQPLQDCWSCCVQTMPCGWESA